MLKEVFPLEMNDLKRIREYLEKNNDVVFLAIINIGVNTALRYSDLSRLTFEEVAQNFNFIIREKKTNKIRHLYLNKICINEIERLKRYYTEKGIEPKGFIFKSLFRPYIAHKIDRPITVQSVNKKFKSLQKKLDIKYNIGTHSLRKTWGFIYYSNTGDIATLMYCLNHSNENNTLRYIGITDKKIGDIFINLLI
ncbi:MULTISPECIES: tyrosine-type recombinase/integrase [unclassified Fusobacterium]|uniref:tyrosine-type recombinase/integrase n=1 Tax=unclassified Fusobacterium TaxID=2648384 RepID=UPI001B8B34FC|nr:MULTISPECIES: tyrosine-type recombinase/integrase [unclassified Fusobacterium]MBR8700484.1 hypothetical protein [Fusobacterium sp. DD45]MBR8710251.1 hypothetical protein [Fusobacterium sp. DD28]MBR8750773.1 hypothetical protein [Fusobacterium sp. DD26]